MYIKGPQWNLKMCALLAGVLNIEVTIICTIIKVKMRLFFIGSYLLYKGAL